MTVAGQTDALTALERLRLHVHDHETFPFSPEDAEEILEEYEVALTELQHRRAGTPDGWKLIPRRPTEDMMQAGNYQSSHDSTSADVYSAWVDMWDAAPSPDEYENPSKLERKLAASPSSPASGVRVKTGIYVASKVKHAEMWRDLRSFEKMPIISTWIDELYPDDMDGLWQRCISEASNAQAFLILRRPDEVLKGAWIELGAALASGVPVYAVGIEEYTVAKDKRIRHFPNLVEARAAIRSAIGEHP